MRKAVRSGLVIGALAVALSSPPTGAANSAHLLKDVDPGSAGSQPYDWGKLGKRAIFVARDSSHGFEPWISDGTKAGTHMIKDLRAGPASGAGSTDLVHLTKKKLILNATTKAGDGIWVTDGTSSGTKLVKTINNTKHAGDFWLADQALNGVLLFFANDGVHGEQLWRTNGTKAGTRIVKLIGPSGSGVQAVDGLNLAGSVWFMEIDDGTHGVQLWHSDGTKSGTYMLGAVNTSGSPGQLGKVGTKWLFAADDGTHGASLFRTDGTHPLSFVKANPAGSGGSTPGQIQDLGGKGYFQWYDGPDNGTTHGNELWVTDGTGGGTHLAVDILPGGDSVPQLLGVMGGKLYLEAKGSAGWGLWQTDGSDGGTHQLAVTNTTSPEIPFENCGDGVVENGKLYFLATDDTGNSDLWVSNGTDAGTHPVKDINPTGDADPGCPVAAGGHVYFDADDGTHGHQLWITDGTAATTHRISSASGTNAYVNPGFQVNGHFFAEGADGAHGDEPWIYNP